jgi:hypothetical protein
MNIKLIQTGISDISFLIEKSAEKKRATAFLLRAVSFKINAKM